MIEISALILEDISQETEKAREIADAEKMKKIMAWVRP